MANSAWCAALECTKFVDTGHPLAASCQLMLCEALQCCFAAQVLLTLRQHSLLCFSSKAVLWELSGAVHRRHSRVLTPIAASCSAGMTEASPTCTMGGLKVPTQSAMLIDTKVCRKLQL